MTILELRRKLFLQARIAAYTGVSKATVSRVLRRAGLPKLGDLSPKEDVLRSEHDAPGDLLHIDIKKLGRFDKAAHRSPTSAWAACGSARSAPRRPPA